MKKQKASVMVQNDTSKGRQQQPKGKIYINSSLNIL